MGTPPTPIHFTMATKGKTRRPYGAGEGGEGGSSHRQPNLEMDTYITRSQIENFGELEGSGERAGGCAQLSSSTGAAHFGRKSEVKRFENQTNT